MNVKEIRERHGLTQKEFAELIGVSTSAVSQWEQGKKNVDGPTKKLIELYDENPSVLTVERPMFHDQFRLWSMLFKSRAHVKKQVADHLSEFNFAADVGFPTLETYPGLGVSVWLVPCYFTCFFNDLKMTANVSFSVSIDDEFLVIDFLEDGNPIHLESLEAFLKNRISEAMEQSVIETFRRPAEAPF